MVKSVNTKQVFVGSSSEGRPLAEKVIDSLTQKNLSPLPWFDFFKNSRPPLQELEHLTLRADAAILVATVDDKAIIRQKHWHQMRDNVLFEYGLFAGTIGRSKCGLILPNVDEFRIPSDFLGVSCFETYDGMSIDKAASVTVRSLTITLGKPQPDETTQIRGRRLLSLIGWIRDESLRLVQEWDSDTGRELVADRIVAVSGFLQEDIAYFNLGKEYEAVESAVLDGIKYFPPLNRSGSLRYDMRRKFELMVKEKVPPHREVLDEILYMFERTNIPWRSNSDCDSCRYWQERYDRAYRYSQRAYRYNQPQRYGDDDKCSCGSAAYALGAAEAASVFENMIYSPISQLKNWSERFVTTLNVAVSDFERKLHEHIFGSL